MKLGIEFTGFKFNGSLEQLLEKFSYFKPFAENIVRDEAILSILSATILEIDYAKFKGTVIKDDVLLDFWNNANKLIIEMQLYYSVVYAYSENGNTYLIFLGAKSVENFMKEKLNLQDFLYAKNAPKENIEIWERILFQRIDYIAVSGFRYDFFNRQILFEELSKFYRENINILGNSEFRAKNLCTRIKAEKIKDRVKLAQEVEKDYLHFIKYIEPLNIPKLR